MKALKQLTDVAFLVIGTKPNNEFLKQNFSDDRLPRNLVAKLKVVDQ
tara:strand:- start:743 stop:883 length:141 start_codon:yes stop_codon:yes gene_type:complete